MSHVNAKNLNFSRNNNTNMLLNGTGIFNLNMVNFVSSRSGITTAYGGLVMLAQILNMVYRNQRFKFKSNNTEVIRTESAADCRYNISF